MKKEEVGPVGQVEEKSACLEKLYMYVNTKLGKTVSVIQKKNKTKLKQQQQQQQQNYNY